MKDDLWDKLRGTLQEANDGETATPASHFRYLSLMAVSCGETAIAQVLATLALSAGSGDGLEAALNDISCELAHIYTNMS